MDLQTVLALLRKLEQFPNIESYIIDPSSPEVRLSEKMKGSLMVNERYLDVQNPLIEEWNIDEMELGNLEQLNEELSAALQEFVFVDEHPNHPIPAIIALLMENGLEVFQSDDVKKRFYCEGWMIRLKTFVFQFA